MKNNMKASVMFMMAVMALTMTGCGNADSPASASRGSRLVFSFL